MGFFIYYLIFISMRNNVVKKLLKESLHIESLLTELNDELDFSSFKMNDDLQPDIWDSEGNMNEGIRTNLIKIADNYWKSLDLDFDYEDITLTGSLANYNWSKYSDVDLHIIFDINKLGDNKEMVKDLLDVKTRKWNSDHDITIKGFEVELYLQPSDIEHFATGVYSIMNNEWNIEPKKEIVKLDKETIRKKYREFVKQVNDIDKDPDNQSVISRIDKLKDKIKKMRMAGLETGGDYSVENIAFKLLRRNDIMQKLGDIATDAYDDEYTIDEELLEEGLKDWLIAGSLALATFAPNSVIAQEYNDGDDNVKEKIFNKIKVAKENGNEKATVLFNKIKAQVQKTQKSDFQKQVEELLDDGYNHKGTDSEIHFFEKYSKNSKGIQRSEGPGNHILIVRAKENPRDFLEFKKGNNTVVFFYK